MVDLGNEDICIASITIQMQRTSNQRRMMKTAVMTFVILSCPAQHASDVQFQLLFYFRSHSKIMKYN